MNKQLTTLTLPVTQQDGSIQNTTYDLAPFWRKIKDKPGDEIRVNANTTNLQNVIANAIPGTIIELSIGHYDTLVLTGPKAFPENLTLEAPAQGYAYFNGVIISSGDSMDDIYYNKYTANTIMPKGLTFKNINFKRHFILCNCEIENLTIEGCRFENNTHLMINPNGINDGLVDSQGYPAMQHVRYPHAKVKAKNITITRNIFMKASDQTDAYMPSDTAIMVRDVENIDVVRNDVRAADYNAIQISGLNGVLATGKINVNGNIITNTGSRAIRIANLENADIYVENNTCNNTNLTDQNYIYIDPIYPPSIFADKAPYEYAKISGYKNSRVTVSNNTGDGYALDTATGFSVYPSNGYETDTYISTMDNSEMGLPERNIDAWLNSLLSVMSNNSIKPISITSDAIANGAKLTGTIYKESSSLAAVLLTKVGTNDTWTKTKVNNSWDPVFTFSGNYTEVFYYNTDTFLEAETEFNVWLSTIFNSMADNSYKFITVYDNQQSYDHLIGVIHKIDLGHGIVTLEEFAGNLTFKKVLIESIDWRPFTSEYHYADSIIAEGNTNGIRWRKWNSGKAECWARAGGDKTVEATSSFTVSLPIEFTNCYPILSSRYWYGDFVYSSPMFKGSVLNVTATKPTGGAVMANQMCFNFYVIGEWK